MNYAAIIEWLARDVLDTSETAEDVPANVDRYMEDLTAAVNDKAAELAKTDEYWPDEPA